MLPCFFDVPVKDVLKIVKMSAHTMLKIRKSAGLKAWPFEQVKRGQFRMSWDAIERQRKEAMDSATEKTRHILTVVAKRAWLMRALFGPKDDAKGAPPLPEEADLSFLDTLFDSNDGFEALPEAPQPQVPDEILDDYHRAQLDDDRPLEFDFASGPYEHDDGLFDEDWGLLGRDD